MGSSLPNQDAKVGIGQTEENQKKKKKKKTKKTQGQTASDMVRAKNIENNNLYDA